MSSGVRQGPSWHREGFRWAGQRCAQSGQVVAGGGLAAAATGAGVGQNVVVASVLDLALGLAPGPAFSVQELAALPLLPP